LQRRFSELGLRVVPSQANFLLVDVARPAAVVAEALLSEGVAVRSLSALRTMLRITVGTHAENERCLSALQAVLA
jgi:histidinol-phosphate aminotransferase